MDDFKTNKELREVPLKKALKTYIIPLITKKYNVIGVRIVWNASNYSNMYTKRKEIQDKLSKVIPVVAFISCTTGLEERKEEKQTKNGYSFWIVFECPDYHFDSLENHVCKLFYGCDVEIDSCKPLKPRGKNLI